MEEIKDTHTTEEFIEEMSRTSYINNKFNLSYAGFNSEAELELELSKARTEDLLLSVDDPPADYIDIDKSVFGHESLEFTGRSIKIPYSYSVITNVWLVVKYDSLNTANATSHFMSNMMDLIVGNQKVCSMNLKLNILMAKLAGKDIEDSLDEVRIPLIIFDMMPFKMFPVYKLLYHEIYIYLSSASVGTDTRMKIFLDFDYYIDDGKQLSKVEYYSDLLDDIKIPVLTCVTSFKFCSTRNSYCIPIYKSFKFVMIEFINIFSKEHNELINMPYLNSVTISVNDKDPMVYDDDLMEVVYVGKKLYLIPFTPELSNWEGFTNYCRSLDYNVVGSHAANIQGGTMRISFDTDYDLMNNGYGVSITIAEINGIMMSCGVGSILIN